MDPKVPLVVPEVNPKEAKKRPKGIISNPNCTTLSMIVAMGALNKKFELKELVVASYQAASGAGQPGIDTLREQMSLVAGTNAGEKAGDVRKLVKDLGAFPAPLALNVIPWAGSLKADGYSSEELKVRNESRKILGMPKLKVSTTGVTLLDDPENMKFPTPNDAVGTDATWVGRVRQSLDDKKSIDLFLCGDNLRKGAALNAAQIAELLAVEFTA
jgi:aspartate-semialdehyde dehydrogenase